MNPFSVPYDAALAAAWCVCHDCELPRRWTSEPRDFARACALTPPYDGPIRRGFRLGLSHHVGLEARAKDVRADAKVPLLIHF